MRISDNFYRCILVALVGGVLAFHAGERLGMKLKMLAVKDDALEKRLSVLEEMTEPIKEKIKARYALERILERFEDRLSDDPAVIAELIMEKSGEYRLDPILVLAIIKAESDFRKDVVSIKGAVGLMQVMPVTAKAMADEVDMHMADVESLEDVKLNITLGMHYFAKLVDRFGSLRLALEAYNRGPSLLRRQLKDGHRIRTRYAEKVIACYQDMVGQLSRID